MLPLVKHITELHSGRHYVTLLIGKTETGSPIHITSTIDVDGTFDEGDIMIHLPQFAFVSWERNMKVIL